MLFAAAATIACNGVHGGMTITSNSIRATLFDSDGGNDAFDSYSGTAIPASQLVDATSGNNQNWSRVQLDYTQSASGATLSHGISLNREGGIRDYSRYQANSLEFTVDAATNYDASGFINVSDVGASLSGLVFFRAFLRDVTNNVTLFDSFQHSENTHDENFILGELGGDSKFDYMQGSLTGFLTTNVTYEWYSDMYLQAYPDADLGASASGDFTLKLGDGGSFNAVPEPASFAIWGLGALGVVIARRRKHTTAYTPRRADDL